MAKEHIRVENVYPITRITYPGETEPGMVLILDVHLQEYTPPIKMASLHQQLVGQTRAEEGVYASDVERWLNGQDNNGC